MTLLRLLTLSLAIGMAGHAHAADMRGAAPGPVAVVPVDPVCSDPGVVRDVVSRFNWAERKTFHRGVALAALANPRPNPDPVLDVGVIAKRYCMAEAMMTDGRQSTAYYVVSFGQGFASIGDGLEFCVLGFDSWRVYDGACRTVR